MKSCKQSALALLLVIFTTVGQAEAKLTLNKRLCIAAENGKDAKVKEHLDEGAKVNQKDCTWGGTPLVEAASNGQASTVKVLLAHGAKVSWTDDYGYTALYWASNQGDAEVVKILLDHRGAAITVNKADHYGSTPLMEAAREGYASVVELLLRHGASVDKQDEDGNTAPTMAASEGHDSVVQAFSRVLITASGAGHTEQVQGLIKAGANVNGIDENGRPALALAACHNHPSTVRALVDAGATLDTFHGRCITVTPAGPREWGAATCVAVATAAVLLWLLPCLRARIRGRSQASVATLEAVPQAESFVAEEADAEEEPWDEQLLDGAKQLVYEAWLQQERGSLKFQALLHSFARLNSQAVITPLLAWLCTAGMVEEWLGGFQLAALGLSVAITCFMSWRQPNLKIITAMDVLFPKSLSISGFQGVDGRVLAVLEMGRLVACLWLTKASLSSKFWTSGWPPQLPDTPAANRLMVMDFAGLHFHFKVICGVATVSVVGAVLHVFWTMFLLVGSSPAALHVQGKNMPEGMEDLARKFVQQRKLQLQGVPDLATFLDAAEMCTERQGTTIVRWAGKTVEVELIGQTITGRVKFMVLTVTPVVLDVGTDLLGTYNYMNAGHVMFGTVTLTLFVYTTIKDHKKWRRFVHDVRTSLRLGYRTQGFWELCKGEVEDESLLSLMLNLYGLPWAVVGDNSLALQLFSILLSLKAVAERLAQRDLGL